MLASVIGREVKHQPKDNKDSKNRIYFPGRETKKAHPSLAQSQKIMWVRAWIAFGVSTCAWAQQTNTHVQQNGGQYGWGWQFTPGEPTVGHYFVKLPQAEQSVRYSADNSGYHGALAVNTSDGQHVHTARFALGQRALELNNLETIPQPFHLPEANKSQQHPQGTNRAPVSPLDIFLLQHQYAAPEQELFQVLPTAVPANLFHYNPNPFYYRQPETTPLYNVKQSHPVQNNANNEDYKAANEERSRPLQKEDTNEQDHEVLTSSVVKVFKDHNCSRHDSISDSVAKASVSEEQKPNKIPEVSNYQRNINGKFGQKDLNNRPLSYRGAVHFRVEPPRDNARSERYYYTTLTPPKNRDYNENQGISRLVASTQDLISNEDLLRINHAAEKHVNIQTDDIIKPRPRFSLKGEQTKYQWYQHPRSRITVKAKIGKIVDSDVEHTENNQSKEQILQTSSNEYKFVSPIVVADPNANNFKEQIVNNLVSTMVPYIEDGYEIVSVKNTLEDNPRDTDESYNSNEDSVRVTPRPIGQKYLAPITVALRLLNANDTETLNFVEDHDASDSEFIPERVESPRKEKTVVEVQESIPISITHINDVEMHEYLEEGRSNNKGPFDIAKTLYNKYVEALESNKKIQTNMNDFLNKYGTGKNDNDNINEDSNEQNGSQENLESSENIQSEVQVKPNEDSSNERSELVNYYNDYDNQKIIQPIIIEKEVPVTKFVDRFIEKQVPYPEPYEVVKQVPVDRPVAVPVPYEKIVERPYEVTRFVNNPYPVHHHHPFPVEVKVPYPVEKKVFVDRPVPYPVDRIIEKPVLQAVPVPTPVAVPYEVQVPVEQKVLYPVPIETPVPYPVEVEKPVPVERIVQKEVPVPYPVEKRVPYPVHYETKVPVPYPVEKRVPVTVEKIVEKPVTVTKIVEKPVHVQVPVPQPYAVHVREPYPVDRIVEKKVPYPVPVDRIVEKKVHVKVPYPVQTVVEKIVEKPVVVTKYVDKPYPVEKRVPYPVEKIVEKKVPYPVQVPYEVKVPYPVDRYVEKQPHVKGPYQFDRPAPVNYGYGYGHGQGAQTQNIHQYLRHNDQNQQPSNQNPVLKNIQQMQAQVQFLKERQKQEMQSTHWGNNQYASSYQYINDTSPRLNDNNIRKSLAEYISYMTNAQANQYYGPPPMQNSDDWWEKNKDYTVEVKVRRTDRTPKVTKLRIEYGGFKPPLIPSTEVDLDGVPVKKDDEQS